VDFWGGVFFFFFKATTEFEVLHSLFLMTQTRHGCSFTLDCAELLVCCHWLGQGWRVKVVRNKQVLVLAVDVQ